MAVVNFPSELAIGSADFAQYLQESESQAKVFGAESFIEELKSRVFGDKGYVGALLPWSKTHCNVQFRLGEVTLWPGINGHRKSMVTGQVALSLCKQHEKVLIASFEMKPSVTLERMLRQASHAANTTEGFLERFIHQFLKGRMWFYDQQGMVDQKSLFAVLRYGSERLGITHFVIDSLMKCVKGQDDYNAQKDFVDKLTATARDLNVHVHLVHHIRKGESESKVPGKFDVKGAGEVTDMVDNVIVVWKNKEREELARKKTEGVALTAKELERLNEPDQLLIVEKQRNGAWEGKIALWFHDASLQFVSKQGGQPLTYL